MSIVRISSFKVLKKCLRSADCKVLLFFPLTYIQMALTLKCLPLGRCSRAALIWFWDWKYDYNKTRFDRADVLRALILSLWSVLHEMYLTKVVTYTSNKWTFYSSQVVSLLSFCHLLYIGQFHLTLCKNTEPRNLQNIVKS